MRKRKDGRKRVRKTSLPDLIGQSREEPDSQVVPENDKEEFTTERFAAGADLGCCREGAGEVIPCNKKTMGNLFYVKLFTGIPTTPETSGCSRDSIENYAYRTDDQSISAG